MLTEKEFKPPIRVKMKIGEVEFEVECQEDQVQTTVSKILSTVTEKLKETQAKRHETEANRKEQAEFDEMATLRFRREAF